MAVVVAAAAVPGMATANATTKIWKNYGSKLCLGVADGKMQDGTAIIAWGCNGASDQTWTLDSSSGTLGAYLLRNGKDPFMCLSVAAKSMNPWVAVVLWHCKPTADNQDQRWYLTSDRQAPYIYLLNDNSDLVVAADQYWGAPAMQMRRGYWFPFDAWVDNAP
jgi:hypothetical protein